MWLWRRGMPRRRRAPVGGRCYLASRLPATVRGLPLFGGINAELSGQQGIAADLRWLIKPAWHHWAKVQIATVFKGIKKTVVQFCR